MSPVKTSTVGKKRPTDNQIKMALKKSAVKTHKAIDTLWDARMVVKQIQMSIPAETRAGFYPPVRFTDEALAKLHKDLELLRVAFQRCFYASGGDDEE